ncbi:TldD/PmbA family protein [bacterium]|nr:TldD/PmbA family protein [bacterium]
MDKFVKLAKTLSKYALTNIPEGYQAQVMVTNTETETFRFAKNQVTQNASDTNIYLHITVNFEGKEGVFGTNSLSESSIKKAVEKAVESCKFSLKDEEFAGFAFPYELDLEPRNFSIAKPEQIYEKIGIIFKIAKKENVDIYGSISNEKTMLYIENTNKLQSWDCGDLNKIVIISEVETGGTGYSGRGYVNIEDLDVEPLTYESIQKARVPFIDKEIELGDHKVILESAAAATLMNVLAFSSFSAATYDENRSFMSGHLGEKPFPNSVNITDDAYHNLYRSLRIDFEGNRKSKINIVESGVLKNVVHNIRTAKKMNTETTGHALPPPQKEPFPLDVMMIEGNSSMEDMIKSVDKGIYITRFHYIGLVDEKKTTITGMTRNGTFLIENGEIVGALTDLRFTDDITRILENVVKVEDTVRNIPGFLWGANIAPGILTGKFKITGSKPRG